MFFGLNGMFLGYRTQEIIIQQDNAKPHGRVVRDMMEHEGSKDGFKITLVNQPPNSPDLNVLDLGFFNAIQSLQMRETMKSIDDLIEAVERSFEGLSHTTLDNSFRTLQSVMECILKDGGNNTYDLPHKSKAKLEKAGTLPLNFSCDLEVLAEAQNEL